MRRLTTTPALFPLLFQNIFLTASTAPFKSVTAVTTDGEEEKEEEEEGETTMND